MFQLVVLACSLLAMCTSASAGSLPISTFARRPTMDGVLISPDGRYLLYTMTRADEVHVATFDLRGTRKPVSTLQVEERDEVSWCRWVSVARFVCGLRKAFAVGTDHPGDATYLVAVNADGSHAGTVFQHGPSRDVFERQIVSSRSIDQRSILLQRFFFPSAHTPTSSTHIPRAEILRLDVTSGAHKTIVRASRAMPKWVRFISDPEGEVLLADGFAGTQRIYWTRFNGDSEWRELLRYEPLRTAPIPVPFAIVPGTRNAFAIGAGKRYAALFQIDLTGTHADQLIYESPDVAVREPVFSGDGQMLGMRLDTEKPSIHYLHASDASVIASANRHLPDRFNEIIDRTPDRKVYVIRSSSDVEAGSYYVLDVRDGKGEMELIGAAYPDLDPAQLPRMRPVELQVADKSVRAFLTLPNGTSGRDLPLIVMPDDGPQGRSEWRFSFLRHFLLSNGYAVLQVQLEEATSARNYQVVRRDLDGHAYAAVERGARWATEQGIADPQRVGILGWGFGGYVALLGSQRNPQLFRAVVAVNAVTDLSEQPGNQPLKAMIGNVPPRFSGNSVRSQARHTTVPVLLIHGSHDTVVHPHQTERVSRPLALRGATYDRIEIEYGTHELSEPATRAQMLDAVQRFLTAQLSLAE